MKFEFMECGHVSNAELEDGTPICGVCYGIVDGGQKLKGEPVVLNHRLSKCKYCGIIEKSHKDLPLFQYRSSCKFDLHICMSCAQA